MALRVIGINKEYLGVYLQTIFSKLQNLATGIAIPGIGRDDVTLCSFPLPPLAEQQRIVAKVDELMKLCDELELRVEAAEKKRERLLGTVMAAVG